MVVLAQFFVSLLLEGEEQCGVLRSGGVAVKQLRLKSKLKQNE